MLAPARLVFLHDLPDTHIRPVHTFCLVLPDCVIIYIASARYKLPPEWHGMAPMVLMVRGLTKLSNMTIKRLYSGGAQSWLEAAMAITGHY